MVVSLTKVMKLSQCLRNFELSQIHKEENGYADALLKLTSTKDVELFKSVQLALISKYSINLKRKKVYGYKGKPRGYKKS